MISFFKKKIKLIDILFYALALYPLLKFNLSSIILFSFCAFLVFESYKNKSLTLTKSNFKGFFVFTLYFVLVLFSILYSDNIYDAIKRISRLVPLLIIPALLFFCKIYITKAKKKTVLNIFLIVNILYLIIIYGVYLFHVNGVEIQNITFSKMLFNHTETQNILDLHLGEDRLNFHKAYFSMNLVVLAIFSLSEAISMFSKSRLWSILYIVTFFLFSFLIFFLFSFPNVIALILSIVVFIYYQIKKKKISKRLVYLISFIILIGITSGIYFKSFDIDVKRGINFIKSLGENSGVELNDPRAEIYSTIKSIYKEAGLKDILFGFGIGDVQDKLNDKYNARLLQKTNKNKLQFNEEFDDHYWFKHNINIVSNNIKSPLGNYKADLLEEVSSSTTSTISYNISSKKIFNNEDIVTFSIYAKKSSAKHLILRLGDVSQRATFNLEKGTYETSSPTIKAQITKVNDWYRCSITSKVKGKKIILIGLAGNNGEYKYIGSKNGLYVWGAQLESGTKPTEYIKNDSELIKYAANRELNTHNNYLYFFLAGGVFTFMAFLVAIIALFYISIKNKNVFQITFCIIIAFNFLTENILSRHLGLIFISLMLIIFFTNPIKKLESPT